MHPPAMPAPVVTSASSATAARADGDAERVEGQPSRARAARTAAQTASTKRLRSTAPRCVEMYHTCRRTNRPPVVAASPPAVPPVTAAPSGDGGTWPAAAAAEHRWRVTAGRPAYLPHCKHNQQRQPQRQQYFMLVSTESNGNSMGAAGHAVEELVLQLCAGHQPDASAWTESDY